MSKSPLLTRQLELPHLPMAPILSTVSSISTLSFVRAPSPLYKSFPEYDRLKLLLTSGKSGTMFLRIA
jgi:hypothetical protein